MTRISVYAGLAGFYFLNDPLRDPPNLPCGEFEREILLQDRMFDLKGQLLYLNRTEQATIATAQHECK